MSKAALTAAIAAGVALAVGATGAAYAHKPETIKGTRAALDPALVAGRGASVAFTEQEAETAATNGTVIGPDRTAYTLPAEASGRSAVKLAPGQYVEFTLPKATNAITVRYSIPDAPTGGGITAPLAVKVGKSSRSMTLTSQYSWLYNQYPFSNDPNAGLLHPDWWITECACVPAATTPAPVITTPFRPNHFYDEQRLLLGQTHQAGEKIRPWLWLSLSAALNSVVAVAAAPSEKSAPARAMNELAISGRLPNCWRMRNVSRKNGRLARGSPASTRSSARPCSP